MILTRRRRRGEGRVALDPNPLDLAPEPLRQNVSGRWLSRYWLGALPLLGVVTWLTLPPLNTPYQATPKALSTPMSVEIAPAPEVTPTTPELPTLAAQTEVPPTPNVPSVGVLAEPAGGGGNGTPGPALDLGLEGSGMTVAGGGGGSGGGIGTGIGSGVGTSRFVYESGQTDNNPTALDTPDPPYPRRAKEDGIEALVDLRVLVDERGRVERTEVLGAPPGYGFEAALQDATKRWRFQPASLGGVPVAQWLRIPYRFQIPG